ELARRAPALVGGEDLPSTLARRALPLLAGDERPRSTLAADLRDDRLLRHGPDMPAAPRSREPPNFRRAASGVSTDLAVTRWRSRPAASGGWQGRRVSRAACRSGDRMSRLLSRCAPSRLDVVEDVTWSTESHVGRWVSGEYPPAIRPEAAAEAYVDALQQRDLE